MKKINFFNIWVLLVLIVWFIINLIIISYFSTPWNPWNIWIYLLAWLFLIFSIFWFFMNYGDFLCKSDVKKSSETHLYLHNENQKINSCKKPISKNKKLILDILKYSILTITIIYWIVLIIHLILTTFFNIIL